MQQPEGSFPVFDFQAASDQQPASIITVSGTQLKLGDRVLGEISNHRESSGFVMLLDPDGKKRHCNGRYKLNGGPSPEYEANTAAHPESLILEICELQFNRFDNCRISSRGAAWNVVGALSGAVSG